MPRPGPAPAAPYHHPEFFRLQRTPRFNARYRLACYHVVSSRCCIAFRAADGSSCCHFLAESSGTGSPDHAQEGWARGTRGSASLLRRGGRLSRPEHPGPGSPGLAGSARTLVPVRMVPFPRRLFWSAPARALWLVSGGSRANACQAETCSQDPGSPGRRQKVGALPPLAAWSRQEGRGGGEAGGW